MHAPLYKVIYVILAHKLPFQLARLIERLQAKECVFCIHIDRRVDITPFIKSLRHYSNCYFLEKRYTCQWGRYGITAAMIEGVRWADETYKASYDHVVLLSGQDYPLCNCKLITDHLSKNLDVSFIHRNTINEIHNSNVLKRLQQYVFYLPFNKAIFYPYERTNSFIKKVINFGVLLSGRYPIPRNFGQQLKPEFGSNWLRLSRKANHYFLGQFTPSLEAQFKTVHIADEHLFHMLLFHGSEEDRGVIEEDNFTFCHWDRPPEMYSYPLTVQDLECLINSKKFFARKFDSTYDSKVLDELDRLA